MILFFATHRAKGSQKDQDPFKACPSVHKNDLLASRACMSIRCKLFIDHNSY